MAGPDGPERKGFPERSTGMPPTKEVVVTRGSCGFGSPGPAVGIFASLGDGKRPVSKWCDKRHT